jgi:hypothetical protein
MKNLILITLFFLSPCAHSALTLASYEKIGFVKNKQPYFQMFGAIDGWYGKYQNKEVWIYFFEDKSKMPLEQFKMTTKPRIFCTIQNTIIIEDNEFLCKDAKSKL